MSITSGLFYNYAGPAGRLARQATGSPAPSGEIPANPQDSVRTGPPGADGGRPAASTPGVRGIPPEYITVCELYECGISLGVREGRLVHPRDVPARIGEMLAKRSSEFIRVLTFACPSCSRKGSWMAELFVCECGMFLIRRGWGEHVFVPVGQRARAVAGLVVREAARLGIPLSGNDVDVMDEALAALEKQPGWNALVAYARARHKIFSRRLNP